jgi:hypothetical protein
MLGWIALAVLIGAAVYVVVRLVRSWSAASRRFADPSATGGTHDEPPAGGPPGLPTDGSGDG